MTIEESFVTLYPYLKGFKKTENYRIVETNLKSTWEVNLNDKIQVKQSSVEGSTNLTYNLFFSEEETFDVIVDWIKTHVIDYNLEIEEKERLLKAKVEELKRVFETKTLDELNNLKFTTENDAFKLNGSNKNNNNDNVNKTIVENESAK